MSGQIIDQDDRVAKKIAGSLSRNKELNPSLNIVCVFNVNDGRRFG